ncbi:hypothetical protein TNCV_3339141 [Trichonephila clavipes]|nr:hypothetical protein TNCV_3339141 [Trichonephila clavipes]
MLRHLVGTTAPGHHDCSIPGMKMQGFNLKNRKDISYPTITRSAIRPVPHGPDLPIPSPPGYPGQYF